MELTIINERKIDKKELNKENTKTNIIPIENDIDEKIDNIKRNFYILK